MTVRCALQSPRYGLWSPQDGPVRQHSVSARALRGDQFTGHNHTQTHECETRNQHKRTLTAMYHLQAV